MRQLVAENLRRFGGREISLLVGPPMDGAHDPSDQLLDATLALGRPEHPTEILRNHHIRGDLRPGGRNLDLVLLEDDVALLVGDAGLACLPLDFVEWRHGPPGRPVLQRVLGDLSRVRPLPAEAALAGPPGPGRRHPTYMGAGFAIPLAAGVLRGQARAPAGLIGGLIHLAVDLRLVTRGTGIAALELGVLPIDVSLRAIQRLAGMLDPLTSRPDCLLGRLLRAHGIQPETRRP